MKKTELCTQLGIDYPIIQAPMDWICDAVLAAAVSNAGGLGIIGPNAGARTVTPDVVETGERLRREIRKVKSLTSKPFGVNLIAMEMSEGFPEGGKLYSDQCLKVMLEERIPVALLSGNAPHLYTGQLKEAGIKVLYRGIPASIASAKKAEAIGIDAYVAVGYEGGGHAGTFTSTSVLVPEIADALHIPVVAGGGIANGRGLVAAFAWGASGVFMGTRFIATNECPAHENVKKAIVEANEMSTVSICGVIGPLRALKSPISLRCAEMEKNGCSLKEITNVYHASGAYLKGMLEGDKERGNFVSGQCCELVQNVKNAGDVVREVIEEAEQILSSFKNSD